MPARTAEEFSRTLLSSIYPHAVTAYAVQRSGGADTGLNTNKFAQRPTMTPTVTMGASSRRRWPCWSRPLRCGRAASRRCWRRARTQTSRCNIPPASDCILLASSPHDRLCMQILLSGARHSATLLRTPSLTLNPTLIVAQTLTLTLPAHHQRIHTHSNSRDSPDELTLACNRRRRRERSPGPLRSWTSGAARPRRWAPCRSSCARSSCSGRCRRWRPRAAPSCPDSPGAGFAM